MHLKSVLFIKNSRTKKSNVFLAQFSQRRGKHEKIFLLTRGRVNKEKILAPLADDKKENPSGSLCKLSLSRSLRDDFYGLWKVKKKSLPRLVECVSSKLD